MAEPVPEYDVTGTAVAIDSATGSATIAVHSDKGAFQLYLSGSDFLLLKARIEKALAEARHGGRRMLPVATGCHGLEIAGTPPRLHIRLVLEDGSEGRLPIQEAALHRLMKLATDWFADRDEE